MKKPLPGLLALAALLMAVAPGLPDNGETGCLRGIVNTAENQEPLEGVNILLRDTELRAASQPDGHFTICDINPGIYVLDITSIGRKSTKLTHVAIQAGDTTFVSIELAGDLISVQDVLVVGVSKKLERITQAPAAVIKLQPLHLQQFGATGQIPGLFAAEPGIDLVGNGIYDFNLNTRGFNSTLNRRVLVLQDHRETAMAFLLAQEWNSYTYPPESLGNLEFVRGPGSALYGANAFSGVLNIQTPAPEQMQGTAMDIAVGELNTIKGDFRHAGFYESWGYKINVGGARSDTWDQPRNLPDQARFEREYAGVPAEFLPLDDSDVSTVYASGRVDYNLAQGVITAESGIAQAEDQVFVTGIGRVQVDKVLRPWGRLNFTSDRYFVQMDYNGRKTLDGHQQALNSVVTFKENSHDLNFQFQNNFWVKPQQTRLVWGISHRFQHVDTDQTLTPADYNENQSGVYGHLEHRLAPKWTAYLAARLDRSTLHATQLSPKAALVFAPNPDHALRFTLNRAFQTPNYAEFFLQAPYGAPQDLALLEEDIELAIELAQNLPRGSVDLPLDFSLTPRLARGNAKLNVEKVLSAEIGYKGVLTQKLSLAADVYFSSLSDFVTDLLPEVNPAFPSYQLQDDIPETWRQIATQMLTDSLDAGFTTLPDGSHAYVYSYTNAGKVSEWGLELALSYRLTRDLMLRGNYTFFDYDIRDQQVNERLAPNTPKHKFNLGFVYQNRLGFDLNANLRYVDEYEWAAGIFEGVVPSYTVLDVAAGYRMTEKTRFGFAATNLLDNKHFELFGGSVNGRRVLLSLAYQF